MNIIIIGASGFLGKKIYDRLKDKHRIIGTYSSKPDAGNHDLMNLDITKKSSFNSLDKKIKASFKAKPDLVIHAAAMTDVDYCELHQEEAYLVNVTGTKNIVDHFKCPLVYISTDFVFDGDKGNYTEKDIPHPPNYYAQTKYLGEKAVQENCNDYIIIRVAVLYGESANAKKFTNWAIEQMKNNRQISVVNDQFCTPTLTDDIAMALDRIIDIGIADGKKQDIFHVAGSQKLSRYDMAVEIADAFGFNKKLIVPISSNELKQAAKRGKDTSLDTDKIKSLGIEMSSFHDGIRKVKEQMKAE